MEKERIARDMFKLEMVADWLRPFSVSRNSLGPVAIESLVEQLDAIRFSVLECVESGE